jgi:ERCC4-type nuclease
MAAISTIIDMRERDLIRCIDKSKAPFIIQALKVGDIQIDCFLNDISTALDISGAPNAFTGLVLERKTLADLVASIKDGRWREQKSRLLTYCAEANKRPAYIIEGSLQFPPNGMSASSIRKLMHRLQFRYSICVLMTDDVNDTAGLIETLVEQITADPDAFQSPSGPPKQYYEGVQVSKKANKEDPANFARTVLMQCPGVSAAIADAIIRGAGPKLADVFIKDEKFIASINVTEKRKVGPTIAKRLLGLWNS